MPGINDLDRRLRARLDELARDGLQRTLRPPQGIDLSSNDYLKLAAHPLLKERIVRAIEQEGVGSTGSRLLCGERDRFANLERRFARFKGTERSLYFSSGYLANLAVLTTFPEPGDVLLCDALNHASLIDGARLSRARREIFPHNDVAAVERLLRSETGQKFVVVESLFSMDGDFAPIAQYVSLCRETGAALIVDEAHAVGIYGERGAGWMEEAGLAPEDVFISINTAGKALGVAGAFVAGAEAAIELLVQRARTFIFSTAAPPAAAAAIDAALDLIESEPERRKELRRLASFLRESLQRAGIPAGDGTSHILSIVLGENQRAVAVASALQEEGFDVRAIRPPTVPPGTARLRISVNAGLTDAILDRFTDALEEAMCAACS